MALKTEELKKNPGAYLDQHIDALHEILLIRATFFQQLKAKDEIDDLAISDDEDFPLRSMMRGGKFGLGSQELKFLAPANALRRAKAAIEEADKANRQAMIDHDKATDLMEDLNRHPWSDTPGWGLFAFIQRQILSSINLTPFNGLNRFEVSNEGLILFQPFREVSMRKVTHQDLIDRNVVLSVNPPSYFDLMLGLLGQFRWGRNIPSPWGQLVVDEPGSGRIIGTAVVLWPADKQKQIENLLKKLDEAKLPYYARYRDVPDLGSQLYDYDTQAWHERLGAWKVDPTLIPDPYLKILYIEPSKSKDSRQQAKTNWAGRFGCAAAVVFFFVFILLWPVWIVVSWVWRQVARFLPRPLRFFAR